MSDLSVVVALFMGILIGYMFWGDNGDKGDD